MTVLVLLLAELNNCKLTTRTFDVSQQCENELGAKLQLVRKMVLLDYPFSINPNGNWVQFPEMKIDFFLECSQFVNFDYLTIVHG